MALAVELIQLLTKCKLSSSQHEQGKPVCFIISLKSETWTWSEERIVK
ncbi:hypothetical protein SLEP1_g34110 [Rubroshorea leprosula]|uniref:Uncharacterized protein n=1 Tax=Rubroshorea leprosula TaxID=152421 RepID=A0AAV5KIX9_9ROSI|nr:hypothetical protein SLEP1_g34110 [Rubroshorea leprosula]